MRVLILAAVLVAALVSAKAAGNETISTSDSRDWLPAGLVHAIEDAEQRGIRITYRLCHSTLGDCKEDSVFIEKVEFASWMLRGYWRSDFNVKKGVTGLKLGRVIYEGVSLYPTRLFEMDDEAVFVF